MTAGLPKEQFLYFCTYPQAGRVLFVFHKTKGGVH
jgi:hypothetical protein